VAGLWLPRSQRLVDKITIFFNYFFVLLLLERTVFSCAKITILTHSAILPPVSSICFCSDSWSWQHCLPFSSPLGRRACLRAAASAEHPPALQHTPLSAMSKEGTHHLRGAFSHLHTRTILPGFSLQPVDLVFGWSFVIWAMTSCQPRHPAWFRLKSRRAPLLGRGGGEGSAAISTRVARLFK